MNGHEARKDAETRKTGAGEEDSDELHEQVARRLAYNQQHYTSGRRRIVTVLGEAARPLTIPEITAITPGVAQSSAYRNLDVLEQCGAVRRLTHAAEHTHFELAEPLLGHHHHLICEGCTTVVDVHLDDELERLVDQRLGEAARAAGFEPGHHSLDMHGLCSDCQSS